MSSKKKIFIILGSLLIIGASSIIALFIGKANVTEKDYAGFIQKDTRTDFSKNGAHEYYQNMMYSDGIYYKRIYSYDEYLKATEIWENLVEMSESDFKKSFVLIIAGQNYETTNLYISDIYVKDNTTYVELRRKDKWSAGNTVISAKISKELDKEKIEIKNLPNVVSTAGKYIELNEITMEYTKEQAIEDGCFVVENYGEVISDNKKQLDEFIEKKENGVLRIYRYGKDYFTISDIQYNNGVVNINSRTFNLIENTINPITYSTGNEIKKQSFLRRQIYRLCIFR